MDKYGIASIITMIVLIVALTVGMSNAIDENKKSQIFFRAELKKADLKVMSCTIESPSVIVRIETPEEFILFVIEQGHDIVYEEGGVYYIFNQDLTMGWEYTPRIKDFKDR